MSLTLDPKRPIYLQIMEEIKKSAVRGDYSPGAQLPSVREMAKAMEVNPNTISRVYRELEWEGFIVTRRGQGSFVTEDRERLDKEREQLIADAAERFIGEISALGLKKSVTDKLLEKLKSEL